MTLSVQARIGLEIHVYVNVEKSKQKLFCTCKIDTNAKPNTNICPRCTGQPGSKPMLPNKEAVEKILAIAQMLDCSINHNLLFQRKHYSWPDLPNGYQRTMSGSYAVPVGEKGTFLNIGITEVHLEEDPARWDPETGTVDYNRCGFPLVEIVTEPDFTEPSQVRDWLKSLVTTLGYIHAIDKDAGIKADVNVSIAPKFQRVEIKNVNSMKSIVKAIEYEVERQQKEKVQQETRAWNDATGKTLFMRSKEKAMDYMFIPDPDLPTVQVTDAWIQEVAKRLPEKPHEKVKRYTKEHRLEKTDATVLASDIRLADLYEKVSREIDPLLAAKWLRRELLRVVNYANIDLEQLKFDATHLIELLRMVEKKEITDTTAKELLEQLMEKPFSPRAYVQKQGLQAVADTGALETFCKQAIKENPQAVADYKAGEEKALNFLVGSVMKQSRGKATPQEVKDILKRLIK